MYLPAATVSGSQPAAQYSAATASVKLPPETAMRAPAPFAKLPAPFVSKLPPLTAIRAVSPLLAMSAAEDAVVTLAVSIVSLP